LDSGFLTVEDCNLVVEMGSDNKKYFQLEAGLWSHRIDGINERGLGRGFTFSQSSLKSYLERFFILFVVLGEKRGFYR
jgi:predicted choloylglycine hydrolase